MPAKKSAKKSSKKGGAVLDADLTSIAVPFGLLLAKQSLEKLSGKKITAKKGKNVLKSLPKKKTVNRVKRVATTGGSNANAAANVAPAGNANAAANVVNVPSGLNTMAHKTGANVGGNPKRSRGRPRSKVGGSNANAAANANASVNAAANAANAVANVPSGVNTMAHKTGANVGGKPKRRTRAKVGGATVKEVCEKVKVAHDACQEEQQINNNNNNNNNNAPPPNEEVQLDGNLNKVCSAVRQAQEACDKKPASDNPYPGRYGWGAGGKSPYKKKSPSKKKAAPKKKSPSKKKAAPKKKAVSKKN